MRKTWAATAAVLLVAGGFAVTGPTASPASAAPPIPTRTTPSPAAQAATAGGSDLYVDAKRCPAGGADGSEDAPFCTIAAAVTAAQPGQTVHVEPGTYTENVTVTRSGNPGAPITIEGEVGFAGAANARSADGDTPVFSLSGVHDVTIRGFIVSGGAAADAVAIDDSSDIVVDGAAVHAGAQTGIRIGGSSSDVTVSRDYVVGRGQAGVDIESGVTGAVVSADAFGPAEPGVLATDAPDLSVTGNTLVTNCFAGIEVAGASTGSIENNIVETASGAPASPAACADPGTAAAISLSAASAANTTADYNLIDPASTGPLYVWGGTSYADLASFTGASGQGAHDIAADPQLVTASGGNYGWYPPKTTSPAIDSADANASNELSTDIVDEPRADDPAVANTGTGAGYYDRGSTEIEGSASMGGNTLLPDPSGTPLEAVASVVDTTSWVTNGPLGTFEYLFDDEPYPVFSSHSRIQHSFRTGGFHCVTSYVSNFDFRSINLGYATVCQMVGAAYDPVAPTRLMDTRSGLGTGTAAPVAAHGEVVLPLASIGATPARDITSVVLNVTITQPESSGFLTVYPDGKPRPVTSSVNFAPGQTVSVLVTVPVGDGAVRFYNGSSGTVQVLADLQGFYGAPGDEYASQTPVRVLDSRDGTGTAAHPLAAGGDLTLNLSGKVPGGTTAVVLNVGVTQPTASGWLALYPYGQPLPGVSNLDFTSGQTVSNLVIVPVSGGQVSIHNGGVSGTAQVFADLDGYFGPQGTPGVDQTFVPVDPTRIADTRTGQGTLTPAGAVASGAYAEFQPWYPDVDCDESCPWVSAIVFNLTATAPTSSGFLTAYPGDGNRPAASNLNFVAKQTVSNAVMVASSGSVKVYNSGPGSVQVIADEEGLFLGPPQ